MFYRIINIKFLAFLKCELNYKEAIFFQMAAVVSKEQEERWYEWNAQVCTRGQEGWEYWCMCVCTHVCILFFLTGI